MRLSGGSGFLPVLLLGSAFALPCAAAPGDPVGAAPSRATPHVVMPTDPIYVCIFESGGVRRETVIALSPEVGALCAKHPEMGPCQYERNACRRSGGRVFAAGGVEITLQMEAEYDRKVMRVLIK